VLSPLANEVYSIEIVETLGKNAAATLKRLGYKNVFTKVGDGYLGWAEHAPFDKIIVTCSPENIPQPLVDQLAEGGRMVIPLGERYEQTLYLYKKVNGKLEAEPLQGTFFVPMTGQAEDKRVQRDDDGRPDLRNGSFEDIIGDGEPAAWYYVRQAKVASARGAPDGDKVLTCTNQVPGQWSQAVQAIGLDGRRVKEIQVLLSIRTRSIRPGQSPDQRPGLIVSFFDENRNPAGKQELGPWLGNADWNTKQARFKVPARARLAVLAVGLFGSTGELSIDNLVVKPLGVTAAEPAAKE
jgi:protein-L-isoaspartate(D-aspartate) O-methyltransferase